MNAVQKEVKTRSRKNSIPVFEPTKNPVSNVMLISTSGIEPEYGMGATLCYHNDRHAATIIEVRDYRDTTIIVVQEDLATRIDYNGASFDQRYNFKMNPQGRKYMYMFKEGRWEGVKINENSGRIVKSRNNPALIIGTKDHFFDFTK